MIRPGGHLEAGRGVLMGWRGVGLLLLMGSGCMADREVESVATLDLQLEQRLGSLDGELSLQPIRGITLSQGRGDTLFVVQAQTRSVWVLSAQGDSLGAIGRFGSGPGEFTGVGSVAVHQDTLWISDVNRVVSRFTADGQFIDQLRFPLDPLGEVESAPHFIAPLADGTLLFRSGYGPGSVAAGVLDRVANVRVNRAGEVLDTLMLQTVAGGSMAIRFADGARIMGLHPVDSSDRIALDPRGRWVVVASTARSDLTDTTATLTWVGIDGETLHEQTVHARSRPTSDARERFIDQLARGSSATLPWGALDRVVDEQVPWPSVLPPVTHLFADLDGRTWVATVHETAGSDRWFVFGEDGETLGSLVLPENVRLLAARGSTVWGWTTGAYDEPYLLRFSLGEM
ncbi:MAG: 6-bladed beta-propeller [Gemmatimonadales bacterium]|nr:MAG: 6-bladed beta-propeller [Gemmatimonadales bacterium]